MKLKVTTLEEIEADLIARSQQGDRGAFGELVGRHRKGVVNLVYRMCGDAELAQDMAQETFIRAWTNLPGYQPRSAFRNWVFRIATNATLDILRREKETLDVDSLALPSPGKGLEAEVEVMDRAEAVQQAVLGLPPASRNVLILREYEGLSYREIAETLDIPIGTVMSRLNYARQLLLGALGPLLEDDGQ